MSNESRQRAICFDITDIALYATGNSRVSGIQRVQLNIIFQIARQNPSASILCTFIHPQTNKVLAFHPREIDSGREFDGEFLLQKLGLGQSNRFLPPRPQIKKNLSKYSSRRFLRIAKKLEIYLAAVFFPAHLKTLGLERPQRVSGPRQSLAELREISLQKDDLYVLLGANWANHIVVDLCKAHAARGGDVIQMVYDVIPIVRPEFVTSRHCRDFQKWLSDVVTYANHFLCISEFTEKELARALGPKARGKTIQAIALAHELEGHARNCPRVPGSDIIANALQAPYVLCVGTIEIRKNGAALLKAWDKLLDRLGDQKPQLVFAGKRGSLTKEFDTLLATNEKLNRSVQIIESPSDADLVALYQRSLFTVYPSLYEGWGLPVGEAAWLGKMCLASSASSVPEVCGDLSDYVDPTNIDQIANELERLIRNPDQVQAKEARIRTATLRTWSDVARDIFQSIKQHGERDVTQAEGSSVA